MMKKTVILLALVAMLAAGAGYLAGYHEQAPAVEQPPARKVLYWSGTMGSYQ